MKKVYSILLILLLSISAVSATRYIQYEVFDGKIFFDDYDEGTNPLTDVNAIGFECLDANCTMPDDDLWNGNVRNSGSSNLFTLDYPTALGNNNGYGVIFYKPGYVTWEQAGITYAGTKPGETPANPTYDRKIYLTKAETCRAQVDTFSIINDAKPNIPLVINVSASINATTRAALEHSGPIDYVPDSLKKDYYSLETDLRLEIFRSDGSHALDESKTLYIEFSGNERVGFSWTPDEADDYVAVISTYVTDAKCMDSSRMESTKEFKVLSEEPEGMCYTLLNNLNATPVYADKDDNIKIYVDKTSNEADGGVLTPVATKLTLDVFDDQGSVIYNEEKTVTANANDVDPQNVMFDWTSTKTGLLRFKITGIADGCAFDNNTQEIVTMNYFIRENKAPEFTDNLPDQELEKDSGFNDDLIDLWDYVSDNETSIQNLEFSISSQTDTTVANCVVDANRYIDCTEFGKTGYSDVTVTVSDGVNAVSDTFRVSVVDATLPACSNGIDDDNDGAIDFPADIGCDDADDADEGNYFDLFVDDIRLVNSTTETKLAPALYDNEDAIIFLHTHAKNGTGQDVSVEIYVDGNKLNGIDKLPFPLGNGHVNNWINLDVLSAGPHVFKIIFDVDGEFDEAFEGNNERTYNFNIEAATVVHECSNGVDDDGDGYIDYPADFGCSSADDDSELNDGIYACNNGLDDDNDGKIDQADPGCSSFDDNTEEDPVVACVVDADCGTDGFAGQPFCYFGNVNVYYKEWTCLNGGSAQARCESVESKTVTEVCDKGCSLGTCLENKDDVMRDSDLYIEGISLGNRDRFRTSDYIYFSITLKNQGKTDFDGVKASVFIPELGFYNRIGRFDIKDGDSVTKSRAFDLPPYTEPGIYDVRIVVSNDDIERIVYRELVVE